MAERPWSQLLAHPLRVGVQCALFGALLLLAGCALEEPEVPQVPIGQIALEDAPVELARLVPADTLAIVFIKDPRALQRTIRELSDEEDALLQDLLIELTVTSLPFDLDAERPWALALVPPRGIATNRILLPVLIAPLKEVALVDLDTLLPDRVAVRKGRDGRYAALAPIAMPAMGEVAPLIARAMPDGDMGYRVMGRALGNWLEQSGMATELKDLLSGGPLRVTGGPIESLLQAVLEQATDAEEMRLVVDLDPPAATLRIEHLGLPEAGRAATRIPELASWLPERAGLHAAYDSRELVPAAMVAWLEDFFREQGVRPANLAFETAVARLEQTEGVHAEAIDLVGLGGMTPAQAPIAHARLRLGLPAESQEVARAVLDALAAPDHDVATRFERLVNTPTGTLPLGLEAGPPLKLWRGTVEPEGAPGMPPASLAAALDQAGPGVRGVLAVRPRRLARQLEAQRRGEPYRETGGLGAGPLSMLWIQRTGTTRYLQFECDLAEWADLLMPDR